MRMAVKDPRALLFTLATAHSEKTLANRRKDIAEYILQLKAQRRVFAVLMCLLSGGSLAIAQYAGQSTGAAALFASLGLLTGVFAFQGVTTTLRIRALKEEVFSLTPLTVAQQKELHGLCHAYPDAARFCNQVLAQQRPLVRAERDLLNTLPCALAEVALRGTHPIFSY